MTGNSWGSGNSDYATVKYNSAGEQQWVARYNGEANNGGVATAIAFDKSGKLYVTGTSGDDYVTIKYNSAGEQQWVARYDGPGHDLDAAYAIAVDTSDNVYVTGFSGGAGTDLDYATIKYDSAGQQQWVARYDGPVSRFDEAAAMAIDSSGNVYVTGISLGSDTVIDFVTVKYDSLGKEQWVARYNNGGGSAIALTVQPTCMSLDTATTRVPELITLLSRTIRPGKSNGSPVTTAQRMIRTKLQLLQLTLWLLAMFTWQERALAGAAFCIIRAIIKYQQLPEGLLARWCSGRIFYDTRIRSSIRFLQAIRSDLFRSYLCTGHFR